MSTRKRVAVIGAGPCGLGAVGLMKEEGLDDVTCFERTDDVGGLWRYHDDDINGKASVMKTTIINTSKEIGAISNYPPPAHYPNYMHNSLMYKYIKEMAVHFDVLKHVRFHHQTEKIEKTEDYEVTGRWKVTNKNLQTGELVSEVFDFVAVCIGHHVYPNEPTFPNQAEFEGKVLHTHSLKKVDGFEDQRVVVVGAGNSAMDAAVELSSVTKQVYLSSRRGTWVFPRVGPGGYPFDGLVLRRYMHLLRKCVPERWSSYFMERQLNRRFNHALYNLKPEHYVFSTHPTVSDPLPIKLLSGVVVTRGNIKRFTKKGVVFDREEDETEVDSVVLATGYKVKFPFLSDDIVRVVDNRVQLYRFIIPPHLPHHSLAILGLIQPNGPGFPVGEMQCRWAARVFSGKMKLPSREEMLISINETDRDNRKIFVDSPRHTLQVDFIGYTDRLAEDIGAKPDLFKLLITDPVLSRALLFGPSLPYQYRLQGPHAWDGARDAILTYRERMVKPLQRPGHPPFPTTKKHPLQSLLIRLLVLIPILYFFKVILFG